MQPQQPDPTNSQYDFIMKDQPKAQKAGGPKLPSGSLPKILILGGAGVFVIALIIMIVGAISGKNGGKFQAFTNLSYRSGEIVRVSKIVAGKSKDPDTLGIIATTDAALTSEQNQIASYLKGNSVKIDAKLTNPYLDKTVDAKLLAAQQNNTLESTYLSYLKENLGLYENQIKAAAPGSGTKGLGLLKSDLASVQALLASPQLQ